MISAGVGVRGERVVEHPQACLPQEEERDQPRDRRHAEPDDGRAGPQQHEVGGHERGEPEDAGLLDERQRERQQEREPPLPRVAVARPEEEGHRREPVHRRHVQLRVARERHVDVHEGHRHQDVGGHGREERRGAPRAHLPVEREAQRDAAREPRHVHEGVVPAAESERAPHLEQRHGGGIARCRVGEHLRRVGADPLRLRHEGRHVSQLEPDARLGGPLHPRVPREERPPEELGEEARVAHGDRRQEHGREDRLPAREPGPVRTPVRRRERRAAVPA